MPDYLFHSQPTLTPAALADVTGLSTDMQRDWRRRGYIKLGTQQDNGRWLYDWYDAFHIYLMRALYDGGCELAQANLFAATLGQDVLMHAIALRYPGLVAPQYRFHRMQKDERGKPEHGYWISIRFNNLAQIETKAFAMVADCLQLAKEIPSAFDEPIKGLSIIAGADPQAEG